MIKILSYLPDINSTHNVLSSTVSSLSFSKEKQEFKNNFKVNQV